jgi:hypothetical protein
LYFSLSLPPSPSFFLSPFILLRWGRGRTCCPGWPQPLGLQQSSCLSFPSSGDHRSMPLCLVLRVLFL